MPSAMAPLDTITTSRCVPGSRASSAIWRHHSPMAASSRPRPSLVTRLEPTLMTTRRASRNTSEMDLLVISGLSAYVESAGSYYY